MNLAGNQAKNLFRSIRTGSPPSIVGIWAAATVVDQIRQRARPAKQLLLRKKLKPGQSYVIRVPGEGEGSLKEQLPAGTVVAEVSDAEESIGTELLSAAAGLVGAAAETGAQRAATETTPKVSRRKRRRQARLATLHEADLDREALSRRRRRKLRRSERRAEKRPTRRRTRKARHQQKQAQKALDRIAKKQAKPSRADRKLATAEQEVESRQTRVDERSSRRRRRKLKKAEQALDRIAKKQAKPSRADRKLATAEQEVESRQTRVDERSSRRRRRKLKKAERVLIKRQARQGG